MNSIRVRLPQVVAWLSQNSPDVVCLQETKTVDDQFPADAFQALGYHSAISGQKTYNGVAILSRSMGTDIATGAPGLDSEQKRYLAATINGVRVINVYVPNGESIESPKYAFKLAWLKALVAHVKDELVRYPQLVVLGDFNIAPDDRDVHDPAAWAGQVLCSEAEREAFRALTALGLHDALRQFDPPDGGFTWWDYRMGAFRRNHGLRIDHVLVSNALRAALRTCGVDREPRRAERPSDHAPVTAEILEV